MTKNNSKVDKILVNQWGYSMSMVSFYRIIKETSKTVTVVRVEPIEKYSENDSFAGRCTPTNKEILNNGKSEEFRVLKPKDANDQYYKGSLDHQRTQYLTEHIDGQSYYYNHCD